MLQNEFPRISCAAIDSIILNSKNKFTDAFHILRNIEYQRRFGSVDDDGSAAVVGGFDDGAGGAVDDPCGASGAKWGRARGGSSALPPTQAL